MEEREKGGRSSVQPMELTCSISSSCESQMQELSWKSSSSSSSSRELFIKYEKYKEKRVGSGLRELYKAPNIVANLNSLQDGFWLLSFKYLDGVSSLLRFQFLESEKLPKITNTANSRALSSRSF